MRRHGILAATAWRAAAAVLIAGWAVAGACRAAGAQATSMSPSEYAERLSRVRTAVLEDIRTGRDTAGASLAPIVRCTVSSPAGTSVVFADNHSLLSSLEAAEGETGEARRGDLNGVAVQIADILAGMAEREPTRKTIAAGAGTARQVLSGSAYASEPIPSEKWLDRLQERLSRAFQKMLDRLKGPSLTAPKIGPWAPRGLLIILGALALAMVIWFLAGPLKALTARLRRRKEGDPAGAAATDLAVTAEEAALVAARAFDKLMDLARLRAQDGDFRSAFRLVYLAALVALDSEGLVKLNRSQTNWEYVRAIRDASRSDLYEILLPVTREFDRIWYGSQPAARADFERIEQSYNAIRAIGAQ